MSERELALKLYALSRKEQKQLLKMLPQVERTLLSDLMHELSSLGLPKDSYTLLPKQHLTDNDEKKFTNKLSADEKLKLSRKLADEPSEVRSILYELINNDSQDLEVPCRRLGITSAAGQYLFENLRYSLEATD